jgi:hypothetical protein
MLEDGDGRITEQAYTDGLSFWNGLGMRDSESLCMFVQT